jgi:hypothetical protein
VFLHIPPIHSGPSGSQSHHILHTRKSTPNTSQTKHIHPISIRPNQHTPVGKHRPNRQKRLENIIQSLPKDPPIKPNPWEDNTIPNIPKYFTHSAADGGLQNQKMSIGITIGTNQITKMKPTKTNSISHHSPTWGHLSSTASETHALEKLKAALYKSGKHHSTTKWEHHQAWKHAQDNKGVLQTLEKISKMPVWKVPGFLIKEQSNRFTWRRIIHTCPNIKQWFSASWKKGHSNNPDINAADEAATKSLNPINYPTIIPNPLTFQVGMDDFTIITTTTYTPNLPIASPTPYSQPTIHTHQGTRKHLHKLWRAISCHHKGQKSYTYQSLKSCLPKVPPM